MLIAVLLVFTSVSLSLATLSARDIAPTTDASAVIADFYSKYSSAKYSGSCLKNDCPDIKSYSQYCASTCLDSTVQSSSLMAALGSCIKGASCGIQATTQLNPFNISINSGNCYLSATAPTVQLVPVWGKMKKEENISKYNITVEMNIVWSGLSLQCFDVPSSNGQPSTSTTTFPCYQNLPKFLSFLCYIEEALFCFGFYIKYWSPCPLNSISNPSSNPLSNPSSNGKGFNGILQFTQKITVSQAYKFYISAAFGPLKVQATDTSDAPTKSYSFVFDAGVPAANKSSIQTAIENAFNSGDPSGNEVSIIKALYNSLITAFLDGMCTKRLTKPCK